MTALTAGAAGGSLGGVSDPRGAANFQAPAQAYDLFIGRYSRELARALIDAAGVRPGESALDVGCGPGGLTAELAAVLGAERVAAADPSAPFAEACRARVPGARVEVAPAEALPFEDGAFDHALAQLVVNFMSDAAAGVREMARVTRAGGVVSAAVWDYAGEMTLLRRFWDAAVALDPAAAERDEGRMPFCAPGPLGDLWSARASPAWRSPRPWCPPATTGSATCGRGLEAGVGPAGQYVAALPPEARAGLAAELRRRLGAGDAPFRLTARAWIATGRVA